MDFEECIQEWVETDNKLKEYLPVTKNLRERKNALTGEIMTHVENNNMENNVINITDGQIKFQNVKVTAPLTFTFITECLNDCISDETQVKQLIAYIKQKRAVKYVADVKRTYTT